MECAGCGSWENSFPPEGIVSRRGGSGGGGSGGGGGGGGGGVQLFEMPDVGPRRRARLRFDERLQDRHRPSREEAQGAGSVEALAAVVAGRRDGAALVADVVPDRPLVIMGCAGGGRLGDGDQPVDVLEQRAD